MEKRNIVIAVVAIAIIVALIAAAVVLANNSNSGSNDHSNDPVSVKSVGLDRTDVSLEIGKSTTLSCTVKPNNATNKSVTWSSSNTSVATVDGNGKVTATGLGSASITVKSVDGGKAASCKVTVIAVATKVTGLTLSQSSLSLNTGDAATLTATVTPSDATNKKVIWKSENASVATVDDGVVTAVSAGTATIVATSEDTGIKATCLVSVYKSTDDQILNEGFVFKVDTVARVLGNANNDDRIDAQDIKYVQGVIDKTISYDKSRNPYVDANNDGKVDSKDIDQIQMIIDKKKGTVWYENYYGEVQKIDFPVTGKKIGVTYWQQAQLVDLVGHWSDVVAANASVSQARTNQYDMSNVVYSYGTTGSSKLTEEFCEGYLKAGVDLILGSPYKATVTEVANTYLPNVPVITLGIGGASCVSSALTLGILMDAEEKSQQYEEYVLGIVDTVQKGLEKVNNSDKPKMLVCRMYEDNDGYISRYGGILVNCANTDGSYQLLSMFANLYTDNSEKGTTPNRTQEWILSQDFDLIFDMEVYTGFQTSSIPGEKFYTPGEYNKRFENSVEYFKGTRAYDNGGVLSSSYIFDGYSGFASLMMAAHMIYPEHFTLKQGQDSLQYWYDNFTVCDVDVTKQGGYYYTGDKYQTQFGEKIDKKGFYKWNPEVVIVDGNYSNCTPAFMDIAQSVYEKVYGKMPDYSGITRESIPANYLYPYSSYVTKNGDGTLTVKTFDNTSVGTSEAYADKVIRFTPTKVLCYTDAYVDTIYMILCDYYGEVAHSGSTPKAEAALWSLVDAIPSSVKSGLASKYGLVAPDSVKVIGTGQEDLLGYCGSFPSSEKLIVFMSE
ncbi:MAG: Ig-like domain-containing protein [Candidatus Methanomethylophilaceae archaeon]|nr:Ig-like domain-containing protein [Candidatus Methanomethylophilaceae archaeon]